MCAGLAAKGDEGRESERPFEVTGPRGYRETCSVHDYRSVSW